MASKKQERKETANYNRYHKLVIAEAGRVLCKLFEVKALAHAPTVNDFLNLANTKTALANITPRIIKQYQFDLVYPLSGDEADINTWDITLISIILRNTCGLSHQEDREVIRIRTIRNETCGHVVRLSNSNYKRQWADLVDAMKDLLRRIGQPNFETETIDRIQSIYLDNDYDYLQAIVDTWRMEDHRFVETRASRKLQQLLQNNNVVTIAGVSGSGKSAIAHHAALMLEQQGYTIYPVTEADDVLKYRDSSDKQVFVFDDPIGKHVLEFDKQEQFQKYHDFFKMSLGMQGVNQLTTIPAAVNSRVVDDTKLIITCRKNILNDEHFTNKTMIGMNSVSLNENETILTTEEKRAMFSKYAPHSQVSDEDVVDIVHNNYNNFPILCKMFGTEFERYKGRAKVFFKKQLTFLKTEIANLKRRSPYQFCSLLLCLVFEKSFDIKCLQPSSASSQTSKEKETIGKLMYIIGLPEGGLIEVERAFRSLVGIYFIQEGSRFRFIHDTLVDAVGYQFGEDFPEEMIEMCASSFIREYVGTEGVESEHVIRVPKRVYQSLAKRFCSDLKNGDFGVFCNPSFRDTEFLAVFCNHVKVLGKASVRQLFFETTLRFETLIGEQKKLNSDIRTNKEQFTDTLLQQECGKGIHYAMAHNLPEIFYACRSVVGTLSSRTKDDMNFILMACLGGNITMLDSILNDNRTVNIADVGRYFSALHMAAASGNTDMVEAVISKGIDANIQKASTYTPLHIAAAHGHVQIVIKLIKQNANVNKCTRTGESPLYLATKNGYTEVVSILQQPDQINKLDDKSIALYRQALTTGAVDDKDILQQPDEINKLDDKSIALYRQALTRGAVDDKDIRVMVVGHYGVGKTALRKRLFGQPVDIDNREATDGIEVYTRRCKINLDSGEWSQIDEVKSSDVYGRLAKIFGQHKSSEDRPAHDDTGNDATTEEHDGTGDADTVTEESELRGEGPVSKIPRAISEESDADGQGDARSRGGCGRFMGWLQKRCCRRSSSASNENSNGDVELVDPLMSRIDEETEEDRTEVIDNELEPEQEPEPEEETEQEKKTKQYDEADILKELKEVVNASGTDTDDNSALLSIWDFAGQTAFYTTHQVFLSKRAIYLLVTDMSNNVDDIVKDDDPFLHNFGSKSCKVSEFVEFWLNSIHWYCGSSDPNVPPVPVILVGTHADKLDQTTKADVVDTYFRCVRNLFMDKKIKAKHVEEADFAVDNSIDNDAELSRLKDKILEVASRQPHWKKKVPARWVSLEKALTALQEKKLKIISRTEIPKLNQALPVPIEDEEEMELFLGYQHDLGTILYFNEPDLKNFIVLDPQWTVNAIKCLITADEFCSKKPDIAVMWREFKRQAILKPELIKAVWDTKENIDFWEHREHLLRLMERLDLIVRPVLSVDGDSGTSEEDVPLFVPCLLKTKPPLKMVKQQNCRSTSHYCLTTDSQFIPTAVFNRLLAACMTKWPVFTEEKKPCIYCGYGMFKVHGTHRLTVYFTYDYIQIWVTQLDTENPVLDSEHCSAVRECVEQTLTRIINDTGTSYALKKYIKCPKADMYSVAEDEMFTVTGCQENKTVYCMGHRETLQSKEMLNGWFEEEEDAGAVGGPPVNTTGRNVLKDNFFKLITFLLDISSKPLRELFIQEAIKVSQGPYTTLDAFLRLNKAVVLKCCKFPSQNDLVFPPGGTAADISEWDITLLSGLLLSKNPALFPALPQNTQYCIKQIREARNNCQHICNTMALQTFEFTQRWNDLETAVYGIASYLLDPSYTQNLTEEIDKLKNEPLYSRQ